jgi:alpha-1,3-rhamnosyltransferase
MIEQKSAGPIVSIVIPCYNHEQFVQEAIQSVIDQDYHNIEFIIIDDGSDDGSVDRIKEMVPLCQKRFERFEVRHRSNRGLSATLNEALSWSKGEFFAPIASDDILLPYKTSLQVEEYLSSNQEDIAVIFGRITAFSNGTNLTPENHVGGSKFVYEFIDIFLRKSKHPAPTAMIRTDKLRRIGGYEATVKIEDFYLWLKLTENSDSVLYIDRLLAYYRRHPGNASKNSEVMLEGVLNILNAYSKHDRFKEAVARSYLVHAGDLVENGNINSIKYLFLALVRFPSLVFSRLLVVFFYRAYLGVSKPNCARGNSASDDD